MDCRSPIRRTILLIHQCPRSLIATSCISLALLNLGAGCAAKQSLNGPNIFLFNVVENHVNQIEQAQRPIVIRHRLVSINFELLPETNSSPPSGPTGYRLKLNLFDDVILKGVLDQGELRAANSFTWFGHVLGVENSQITLAVEDKVMIGNIHVRDAYFQIRYVGKGVHVIYQIDPRTYPPDGEPIIVPGNRKSKRPVEMFIS